MRPGDAVATGGPNAQAAIARPHAATCAVAAAIRRSRKRRSLPYFIENPQATIAPLSLGPNRRADAALQPPRALLASRRSAGRDPLRTGGKTFRIARDFVAARSWLDQSRAQRGGARLVTRPLTLCRHLSGDDIPTGAPSAAQRTVDGRPILRRCCPAISNCSSSACPIFGLPIKRVAGSFRQARSGLRALYERAGLPASTHGPSAKPLAGCARSALPAFRRPAQLKRRCRARADALRRRCKRGHEPLLTLLRPFRAEAARDEARMACDLASDARLEQQREAA